VRILKDAFTPRQHVARQQVVIGNMCPVAVNNMLLVYQFVARLLLDTIGIQVDRDVNG